MTDEEKKRRRISFYELGTHKYRLTLDGEIQVNTMNVKSTVSNNFVLQVKEVDETEAVIDLVTYDKEMIACTNPAFKEMFAVTRQLEKLYDEMTVRLSLEGEVLDIYSMDIFEEKWQRLKNENVPYFGESTDIEDFFKLNAENVSNKEFWINILNEQEFFFLFFQLGGYGQKYAYVKDIYRYNAFRNNKLKWEIVSSPYETDRATNRKRVDIEGWFNAGKSWLKESYGKMPMLADVKLDPHFAIDAFYVFDYNTGWISEAGITIEEIVHPSILFHKMNYKLSLIS